MSTIVDMASAENAIQRPEFVSSQDRTAKIPDSQGFDLFLPLPAARISNSTRSPPNSPLGLRKRSGTL